MAATKYLDYNGLLYFWTLIKNMFAKPSSASPQMDGTASAGSSALYARGDHVHPSDTAKADKATTLAGYGIADAYTKTEIDQNKADKATTLAGYGITDAYTANGSGILYVAFPAAGSAKTITLTATVGTDTYTYEKSGVTFTNGKYYEITVKMTKQAPTDLSMVDCAGNARANGMSTANCYMVHKAGKYKLPLVYGNAIKAGATNAAAYTGVSGQLETFRKKLGLADAFDDGLDDFDQAVGALQVFANRVLSVHRNGGQLDALEGVVNFDPVLVEEQVGYLFKACLNGFELCKT